MLWFLFLVVVKPLLTTGTIWVRTEPGLVVYLDGVRSGITSAAESGLLLHDVKEGTHKVTVEIAGGGSTTVPVNVSAGQTTPVRVSSLALRTSEPPKGGVEIRLAPAADGCSATIGDQQQPIVDALALFEYLNPGRLHVVIACGKRSAETDVNVTSGRVSIIEANPAAGTTRQLGDRERVITGMIVPEWNEKLVHAPLPGDVRRALVAAVPPGIHVLDVDVRSASVVVIEFEAPTFKAAGELLSRLEDSPVVADLSTRKVNIDNAVVTANAGPVRMQVILLIAR